MTTLCRCCTDDFTPENPADTTNPNLCARCVRLGVEDVPPAPTEAEANAHPKGRWS